MRYLHTEEHMARPIDDHEEERLNPGAGATSPQPEPAAKDQARKNDAALPGSQNSDLRVPKPRRGPRGMGT